MIVVAALALIAQDPEGFVELAENGPQLHSRAAWPNRIEAIAPLAAHLRRDLQTRRAALLPAARRQQADARRRRYPFVPHVLSIDWQVQGLTPQLVSLSADTGVTQGGGHSTDDHDVLLWDQARNRAVAIDEMIDRASVGVRFCAAYPDALTGHYPPPEGDPRWTCPRVQALSLAPADTDGNGRFDTLRFLIGPASYFEANGFTVDVAIEPSDLVRLPDGYRPAFEVAGERREALPQ